MLFIAEKPELARAIVDGLGGGNRKRGYYECGKDTVTWCHGHMLRLIEPEEYDPAYKQWDIGRLPFCFFPWKKAPIPKAKEQLAIILGLVKKADIVVNAGDPDPEGQLLVDEILDYAGFKGPVKRVLINDNTTSLVRKALANLRDNSEFAGLSAVAQARQIGDKAYGYNMTRLYTLVARREGYPDMLSVGRVQTPILGLVVRRDREHAGHEKSFYYSIEATFEAGGEKFTAAYKPGPADAVDDKGRLIDAEACRGIAKALGGKSGTVKTLDTVGGETPPPLPYNLLKLQSDASRSLGLLPDAVKEVTQELRDKYRLITYNRSDCQYLSEEQHADGAAVIAAVKANMPGLDLYAVMTNPSIKSRAFDSAKVGAHHGIIPTQSRVDFAGLSENERKVYELIARAYLVQFMPAHSWEKTTVEIEVDGRVFTASSRTTLDKGWRSVHDAGENNEERDGDPFPVSSGDAVAVFSAECRQKETKPKALYTMATLLEDLTRVSQYVKNESLRKALVEKDRDKAGEHGGIGTPATRDEIIKTLFERGFIETRKKGSGITVVSTKIGQAFYDMLPDSAKFPDLTAVWHEQQMEIERGDLDVDSFVNDVVFKLSAEVKRLSETGLGLKIDKHPCPVCGCAMFKRSGAKGTFWSCSSFPACKTTLPDENGKPGEKNRILAVIDPSVVCSECGKPMNFYNLPNGQFFSCSGFPQCRKKYPARDGKPVYDQDRPIASDIHKCPECGGGLVRRPDRKGGYFWGCSTFPKCRKTFPDQDGAPNYSIDKKVTTTPAKRQKKKGKA
ncbi:MAG: DNA topoisomerase III [Planctomycetota bacterium]|nr:DNA topoisomerase III [Planctomycetota bacterium]